MRTHLQRPDPGTDFVRAYLADLVADHLRAGIVAGAFGERLPSEREIAERLKVSRMTVRKALEMLHAGGLIIRRQGHATRIIPVTAVVSAEAG